MESTEFKKILFKVAFCTMACDGHIDDREIDEMKNMDKSSSFFLDLDLSQELELLIEALESRGVKVINELFEMLNRTALNPIQELLILEVSLRIINADGRHDENEIKFINFLRAKLKLHDEVIVSRFGEIDILHTNKYLKGITKGIGVKDFTKNIQLPQLQKIKFNLK